MFLGVEFKHFTSVLYVGATLNSELKWSQTHIFNFRKGPLAPIFARPKSEKCFERAEKLPETG